MQNFLSSQGALTPIDVPGAIFARPFGIDPARGISGVYRDGSNKHHGFLLHQGAFSTIDVPGAGGINPQGDTAGLYFDALGQRLAEQWRLYYSRRPWIDHSDTSHWNNSPDKIEGDYRDSGGKLHGFIRTPGALLNIGVYLIIVL